MLVATDGLRALEILNRTTVDIVVSDVVMPDLDGYDLFMEVRRRGTTPVILMTGYYYDRDHVIKRSRLEGLESVIFKKPIDPARLKAMIRTLTGRAAVGAQASDGRQRGARRLRSRWSPGCRGGRELGAKASLPFSVTGRPRSR